MTRTLASLLIVVALVGCKEPASGTNEDGGSGQLITPKGDMTLDEARKVSGAPIYFVGTSFDGLPLTAIIGKPHTPTFIYGTCEVPPGFDGGCAPPLSIQQGPISERSPARYSPLVSCTALEVHGVPAAFFDSSGGLDVYTGSSTVVIFGDNRQLMVRAAQALRPVNEPGTATDRLPDPSKDIEVELQRCG